MGISFYYFRLFFHLKKLCCGCLLKSHATVMSTMFKGRTCKRIFHFIMKYAAYLFVCFYVRAVNNETFIKQIVE